MARFVTVTNVDVRIIEAGIHHDKLYCTILKTTKSNACEISKNEHFWTLLLKKFKEK